MHWLEIYESTSLWSVQTNNMKQLKHCTLFYFECWCWWWRCVGIVLVFMNVKFVFGFIFAISIAIFNTWCRFILLFCVVFGSFCLFYPLPFFLIESVYHSVHLYLVVVKQPLFAFLTCSIIWLMWLIPRSHRHFQSGMSERAYARMSKRRSLLHTFQFFFLFSFLFVSYFLFHIHILHRLCLTFELLRWLFFLLLCFFILFSIQIIFSPLYIVVCSLIHPLARRVCMIKFEHIMWSSMLNITVCRKFSL